MAKEKSYLLWQESYLRKTILPKLKIFKKENGVLINTMSSGFLSPHQSRTTDSFPHPYHVRSIIHAILGINLSKNDEKSKTCTRKRVIRALRNFEICKNFGLLEIRMKIDTRKSLGSKTFQKSVHRGSP